MWQNRRLTLKWQRSGRRRLPTSSKPSPRREDFPCTAHGAEKHLKIRPDEPKKLWGVSGCQEDGSYRISGTLPDMRNYVYVLHKEELRGHNRIQNISCSESCVRELTRACLLSSRPPHQTRETQIVKSVATTRELATERLCARELSQFPPAMRAPLFLISRSFGGPRPQCAPLLATRCENPKHPFVRLYRLD